MGIPLGDFSYKEKQTYVEGKANIRTLLFLQTVLKNRNIVFVKLSRYENLLKCSSSSELKHLARVVLTRYRRHFYQKEIKE